MMMRCLVPDSRAPSRPAPPPDRRRRGYGGCSVVPRCCSHGPRPPWDLHRSNAGAVPSLPAAEARIALDYRKRWRTGGQAAPGAVTVPNVDTVPVAAAENTRFWTVRNYDLGLRGRRPSELYRWAPPLTLCGRPGSGQAERIQCRWHLPEIVGKPIRSPAGLNQRGEKISSAITACCIGSVCAPPAGRTSCAPACAGPGSAGLRPSRGAAG